MHENSGQPKSLPGILQPIAIPFFLTKILSFCDFTANNSKISGQLESSGIDML
jgi:hypothetical protein